MLPILGDRDLGMILRTFGLVAVGLAAWAVVQGIAFKMIGGGHGWLAPFWTSLCLVVLSPTVFVMVLASKSLSLVVEMSVPAATLMLDLFLLESIVGSERDYFLMIWERAPRVVVLWTALWAAWHILVLVSVLRRYGLRCAARGAAE